MNKGHKPTFFKDIPQGKLAQNEPKMLETMGKRMR
jgi:hypothetical protein